MNACKPFRFQCKEKVFATHYSMKIQRQQKKTIKILYFIKQGHFSVFKKEFILSGELFEERGLSTMICNEWKHFYRF